MYLYDSEREREREKEVNCAASFDHVLHLKINKQQREPQNTTSTRN
jgi:hypothetical protein